MIERREIKGDMCHPLGGPHLDMPVGLVPLRLCTEPHGFRIEVNRPIATVGRHSGAELRLAFPEVSRRHCRFVFESGQWRVYDLNSANGLFLNGERIVEATLYAGDHLYLGGVGLLVESATPVRVLKASATDKHEKLRQIVEFLPANPSRRASWGTGAGASSGFRPATRF